MLRIDQEGLDILKNTPRHWLTAPDGDTAVRRVLADRPDLVDIYINDEPPVQRRNSVKGFDALRLLWRALPDHWLNDKHGAESFMSGLAIENPDMLLGPLNSAEMALFLYGREALEALQQRRARGDHPEGWLPGVSMYRYGRLSALRMLARHCGIKAEKPRVAEVAA